VAIICLSFSLTLTSQSKLLLYQIRFSLTSFSDFSVDISHTQA